MCNKLCCVVCPFAVTTIFTWCNLAVLFTIYPPVIYSCTDTTVGFETGIGYYKLYNCSDRWLVDGFIIGDPGSPHNESYAIYNFWVVTNFFWFFSAISLLSSKWVETRFLVLITMLPWLLLALIIISADLFFLFRVNSRYTDDRQYSMSRVMTESVGVEDAGYRTDELEDCETLKCFDISVYKMSNIAYRCMGHVVNVVLVACVVIAFLRRMKKKK